MKKETVSLAPVAGAKGHTAMAAFRHLVLSFCLLRSTFSFIIDREEKTGGPGIRKTAPCMRPGACHSARASRTAITGPAHAYAVMLRQFFFATPAPFYLANHLPYLLLFASTKFCDFGIPMILRVLIFAISRSQGKFCDFAQLLKVKLNFETATCLVNVGVSRLNLLQCSTCICVDWHETCQIVQRAPVIRLEQSLSFARETPTMDIKKRHFP